MESAKALMAREFGTLPELIRAHARERGTRAALVMDDRRLTYAELDQCMDRIAAALQRDGARLHQAVSIISGTSIDSAAVFLGALRAGNVPAPIAPSSTGDQMAAMVADSESDHLFLDAAAAATLGDRAVNGRRIALDGGDAGEPFEEWLAPAGVVPEPVAIGPDDPFNIIYSSGTTGVPKGIVQPYRMRWGQVARYQGELGTSVTLCSTPLYSNTTLVSFLPTLARGGTVVLMRKFDARRFLELAQAHRVTHAMLVPVQYSRLMAVPDFDDFDLTSFELKTCTSAPFPAALKAAVVKRWPGQLIEYYGMTEGGGGAVLDCTAFPDKLHTVGRPAPGVDVRLIDDDGNEVGPGEVGEVVGRNANAMMLGYKNRTAATEEATWRDKEGNRFIRHGDVGRFDEDGFLILMDRKKDMLISGGFNVFPSDLEAVLAQHPDVADGTVVGVPSEQWGETPVGFYVPRPGATADADAILAWTNAQLGKTQRLSALHVIDELPRSAIGKVLKRELRDRLAGVAA
ncbi:class I adenylate-forming enzyme family protein [uncultured Sphingomonas sp.]|uniref:class I adenylate-forming enzyme family protein n=1 Tax=uncultured Sphingomonas sp. TaxID=158754 RepID=UPI0035CAD861